MEDALTTGGLKPSALGDGLRSAREARGLTLDQLSASTGISKAHLSRLESGARQPSVGILVELAGTLGTRVGTLLGEDADGAPLATFAPDAPRHTAAGLEIASSSGFPARGRWRCCGCAFRPTARRRSRSAIAARSGSTCSAAPWTSSSTACSTRSGRT